MAAEIVNRLQDLGFRDHGEESVAELMRCAPDAAGAKWASALIRRMRLELAKLEQMEMHSTSLSGTLPDRMGGLQALERSCSQIKLILLPPLDHSSHHGKDR